jgi:hypothetical protein
MRTVGRERGDVKVAFLEMMSDMAENDDGELY